MAGADPGQEVVDRRLAVLSALIVCSSSPPPTRHAGSEAPEDRHGGREPDPEQDEGFQRELASEAVPSCDRIVPDVSVSSETEGRDEAWRHGRDH